MSFENGPFISAAAFCERVIRDSATGTLSLINIVDRLIVEDEDGAPAEEGQERVVLLDWFLVLAFKAGDMSGEHELKLVLVYPDETREQELKEFAVTFAEERNVGNAVISKMNVTLRRRGVWWVKVLLDGEDFTRIPFQVIDRSNLPESERRPPPWMEVENQ